MQEDSSLARNKGVWAISSALPLRRSSTVLFIAFACIFFMIGFEVIDAVRSVSIQPMLARCLLFSGLSHRMRPHGLG